jgi:thiamine biosynthesis lipoprotein
MASASVTLERAAGHADPESVAAAGFKAIGTTNEILATRPEVLAAAVDLAKGHLAALDLACSRFRPDSEVSRLAAMAAVADAWCYASPLFLDYLRAAQHGARISDGLVDFTVGSALIHSGYDQDMDQVRARAGYHGVGEVKVPGWERVEISGLGRVDTPKGTVIDFGATAKAHAADMIARLLALQLPGGFLVNLGGDIATSGAAPAGGWHIGIEAADGTVRQSIEITDQAVTTSSTQLRTWATDSGTAHHIIDPRTGRTAETVWGQVTCVATTALEANTASTASLVLGHDAPAWLSANGVSARLERPDGTAVFTGGWPIPDQTEEELPC